MSDCRVSGLQSELEATRRELEEAKAVIAALRAGEADAIVVDTAAGPKVYALRSADEPYRTIVETLNEGALTVGRGGLVLYCNAALAQLVGRDSASLVGRPLADALGASVAAEIESNGTARSFECSVPRSDASRRDCLVSVVAHEAEGETIFCLLVTDLTGQALRLRHYAIIESTDDAVMSIDPAGRITTWNRAAEALFGYTAGEAIGQDAAMLVTPLARVPDGETIRGVFEAALSGRTVRKDTQRVAKNGTVIDVNVTATQIRTPEGQVIGVSAIMRDIRERKQAEESLRMRNRQLDLLASTARRLLLSQTIDDELLESLFTDIGALLGMEMFYHYRPSGTPHLLALMVHGGITDEERRVFSTMTYGELLCGRVAQTQKRLIVEDLQHCEQPGSEVLREGGARSYAGFPLVSNGALIGTIAFISRARTRFRENEVQTVQAICDQIAVALKRAQLQRKLAESEQRLAIEVEDLRSLHALSVRLAGSRELRAVLDDVLRTAADLTGARLGTVQLHTPSGTLDIVDQLGFGPAIVEAFGTIRDCDRSPCATALRTRSRVVVRDMRSDPAFADIAAALVPYGAVAAISSPLLDSHGTVSAMFSLYWNAPHEPTERDLRLLDLCTDLAGRHIERNAAAEALRASEERLRLAAELSGFGVHDYDPKSDISVWSDMLYDITGLARGTPINSTVVESTFHPEDRDRIVSAMARSLDPSGSGAFDEEFRVVRPDTGEVRWVQNRCQTVFADGPNGRVPVRVTGLAVDITSRSQADAALRASELRYRTLFEAIDEGFCVVEVRFDAPDGRTDYRVVEANRAFYQQSGFRETILGHWLREAAPALEEHWYEIYGRVARTGEPVRFEQASEYLGRWFDVYAFRAGAPQDRRVGILFDDISERKRQEEHNQLLMREVNHRAKNMLGLVQAIARQTAAKDPQEFVKRFEQRVQALSASQDVLVKSNWRNVPIEELVRGQLAHFADLFGSRIILSDSPIKITAAAAQAISLAVHELATNAAKYGALANDTGTVTVSWRVDDHPGGPRFSMSWIESGGPPVVEPQRRGFGSMVTGSLVKTSLDGDVETIFSPGGLRWQLSCVAHKVVDAARQGGEPRTEALPTFTDRSAGASPSVLVVEDEPLIALEIAATLEEAGFHVLGPVSSVAQAMNMLSNGPCDAAILDVNLGSETAEPIAATLMRASTPFVIISGYGREQLPGALNTAPLVGKPIRHDRLLDVLHRSMASGG